MVMNLSTLALLVSFPALYAAAESTSSTNRVSVTEADYEGRAQFRVQLPDSVWFYDRAGGGFARLLDREGKDWISFSKSPLKQMPLSAGAGFRGLPNLGFAPPEDGAGHPGFDRCRSVVTASNTVLTRTESGQLAWHWSFDEGLARFRMEQCPPTVKWWFLYEGTVGGTWSPATHYWGTDKGGPSREQPTIRNMRFDQWQWAYFGDDSSRRVLFLAQLVPDNLLDTYWYMGTAAGGQMQGATNGMVVFGFGRGPQKQTLLSGVGPEFIVGFIEEVAADSAGHARVKREIERHLAHARRVRPLPDQP
jgi:hypothetical protein